MTVLLVIVLFATVNCNRQVFEGPQLTVLEFIVRLKLVTPAHLVTRNLATVYFVQQGFKEQP